jgi:predicted Zn-dependent protease
MAKIKPIFVMNDPNLSELEKRAVLSGASELLQLAGVERLIEIRDFGPWRAAGYRAADGSLRNYKSVDWYLQAGRQDSRKIAQLNSDTLVSALAYEPWRRIEDHYDILVVCSDIYGEGTDFVIGSALRGIGTVISTCRFKGLDSKTAFECIKTETMHELGHVLGLVPEERTENVEQSLGKHCLNTCIMRQGLYVPKDWIKLTNDRLRHGALCRTCETDLRNYFSTP